MATHSVEFGARIPRSLYNEFKATFPIYGATSWFIESALREFLARVRENPTLKAQVQRSIDQMLQENRERGADDSSRSEPTG